MMKNFANSNVSSSQNSLKEMPMKFELPDQSVDKGRVSTEYKPKMLPNQNILGFSGSKKKGETLGSIQE